MRLLGEDVSEMLEYMPECGWHGFLRHLKDRGLGTPRLIISDACRGLVEAAHELYPEARWQRCVVHFYRNVFSHVPNSKVADVARMLKAIHAHEDRSSADAKTRGRGQAPSDEGPGSRGAR